MGTIVIAASEAALARDYFVNPSGDENAFPTVQSAVDAVVGQTEIDRANIFIAPGKYWERVSVDKPFVTFIGQGDAPANVTISFNGIPVSSCDRRHPPNRGCLHGPQPDF